MELIYLLSNETREESIDEYCRHSQYAFNCKGVPIDHNVQIINNVASLITFNIKREDKEAAHSLSDLNADFINHFSDCTCLINGASAYFNKKLYPKMNEFERLLREYIYLKQQVSIAGLNDQFKSEYDSEKKKKIQITKSMISGLFKNKALEDMDFNEIYSKLFIDSNYCEAIKKRFFPESAGKSSNAYKATKDEYLEFITTQEEHILWSDLSEGKLDIIKDNYQEIKSIRNDIMHAHNIDYHRYHESISLLDKVLKELRNELSTIVVSTESSINTDALIAALRTLASALDENNSELIRGFSKAWLKNTNFWREYIDEEALGKLLEMEVPEGEVANEITV